jgi:hypothetical protein
MILCNSSPIIADLFATLKHVDQLGLTDDVTKRRLRLAFDHADLAGDVERRLAHVGRFPLGTLLPAGSNLFSRRVAAVETAKVPSKQQANKKKSQSQT